MWPTAMVALRRFLQDRSNLFFFFVLPFMIIVLVGYSGGSRGNAPLAVVGGDSATAELVLPYLAETLSDGSSDGSSNGNVEFFDSLVEALDAVEDDSAAAVAVFGDDPSRPVEFRSKPGRGVGVRSELDRAVTLANRRLLVEDQAERVSVDEATVETLLAADTGPKVETEVVGVDVWRGLSNMEAAAMTQTVLFMFLSALTAASFIVQDRRRGMASRKAMTPLPVGRLVAGEVLGRFLISFLQAVLIVGVTWLVFGVEWGNWPATAAILAGLALVSTGTSVLLGTVFNKPEVANGVGITLALVLAALGGAMAPVEIFPDVMQTIARFTPHFWAVDGLRTSMTGGAISDMATSVVVLALCGMVLTGITVFLFRRRVFRR